MSKNTCIHYNIGVDLGISRQPTAIAVIEQETIYRQGLGVENHELRVRHLERLPLDASYPKVVDRVREVLAALKDSEQAEPSNLIVDITGTGRAVSDLMKQSGLSPINVTITAGAGEQDAAFNEWRIGKADLVGTLQVLYQTDKLKVARDLPLTPILIEELQAFKLKPPTINPNDPESWREGQHDDLVFAVALAAWRAYRHLPTIPDEPEQNYFGGEGSWMG